MRLNRLARLMPPPSIRRYEWAHPGDLVHLDVKPLARIAGVGHRIHGDRRARVQGIVFIGGLAELVASWLAGEADLDTDQLAGVIADLFVALGRWA